MLFKRDLILGQEYLAFLLLNLFDLFLTGFIFKHHGQEANGLAQWVLQNYKLQGFALFKFIMVAVLILICEVIALFSVKKARFVILAGCVLYVAVICYECYIIRQNNLTDTSAPSPAVIMLSTLPTMAAQFGLMASDSL